MEPSFLEERMDERLRSIDLRLCAMQESLEKDMKILLESLTLQFGMMQVVGYGLLFIALKVS